MREHEEYVGGDAEVLVNGESSTSRREAAAKEPRIDLEHGSSRTSGDRAAERSRRDESGMPDNN